MGTFKFVAFPTFNKNAAVLTQRGRDLFFFSLAERVHVAQLKLQAKLRLSVLASICGVILILKRIISIFF